LEDLPSLSRLLEGADTLIHCAGLVRGIDEGAFNRINVDGVARLVQAAQQLHSSPRFLLVSSLAARSPQLSPYAASKKGGEEVLSNESTRLPWVALRPPAVYGPGDRETAPVLRWMSKGLAPVVAPDSSRFSMVFVDDLADAVIELMRVPAWSGQVFELHDGHENGYCWRDVIDTVSTVIQRPIRPIAIPPSLISAAAQVNLTVARWLGYAPMLTPGKVRELRHPFWVADNGPLIRRTGWKPKISLADGMKRTFASLAANKSAAALN
jgi:nucleoside-diphosphate-sugar epimerase